MASSDRFGELGLSILGLASQYPPHSLKPEALETLSKLYYPDSPAMKKVLSINRFTGIDARSSIGTPSHPLVNQPTAPSIAELHRVFLSDGVPLAVDAARRALAEAALAPSDVTHMVSTTCTDSANPGYDHHVARALGLGPHVEKVLLHGVGCSGGLAALRTAAGLCLGRTARGLPARALVVALEVSTTMVRSELDSVHADQETRIGVALFSDCAGALVLANGVEPRRHHDDDDDDDDDDEYRPRHREAPPPPPPPPPPGAVYDLLAWQHRVVPDTEADLGFDVDPVGWKVVLSPRVPDLTQAVLRPTYDALLRALPDGLVPPRAAPADFDWAMHPGGATILSGAEKALSITPEHMRASYDTYIRHGNSSSATIFSVLDRLRHKDMDALAPSPLSGAAAGPKDLVVACAFGPGITVEMCMLRRRHRQADGAGGGAGGPGPVPTGLQTPPETESEVSSRSGDAEEQDADADADAAPDAKADVDASPSAKASLPAAQESEARSRLPRRQHLEEGGPCWSEEASREELFISEALAGVELD